MTFDLKEQMLDLFEFEKTNETWDQMPMLFVYQEDADNERGFTVTIMGLALEGHPLDGLAAMTAAVRRSGMPEDMTGKVLGVVLYNEGWGLNSGDMSAEEMQAWMDSGKRYSEHPSARESKIFTGAHNIGTPPVLNVEVLNLMLLRGEDNQAEFRGETTGRVVDGVKQIFIAMHEAT